MVTLEICFEPDFKCGPGGSWSPDLLIMSQLLWPTELQVHYITARSNGFYSVNFRRGTSFAVKLFSINLISRLSTIKGAVAETDLFQYPSTNRKNNSWTNRTSLIKDLTDWVSISSAYAIRTRVARMKIWNTNPYMNAPFQRTLRFLISLYYLYNKYLIKI